MEILGIGPMELLLVLLLALALVGPRDLGKHARGLGRALRRLYRSEEWAAVQQASRNLRSLPSRLAREAELEELDAARPTPRPDPTAEPDEAFAWRRPSGAIPPANDSDTPGRSPDPGGAAPPDRAEASPDPGDSRPD